MKIEIEVNDIELFAKGFNNAIIAYGDIVRSINLGCEIPYKLEALKTISYEDLSLRCGCLIDVYRQIEKIEKDLGN